MVFAFQKEMPKNAKSVRHTNWNYNSEIIDKALVLLDLGPLLSTKIIITINDSQRRKLKPRLGSWGEETCPRTQSKWQIRAQKQGISFPIPWCCLQQKKKKAPWYILGPDFPPSASRSVKNNTTYLKRLLWGLNVRGLKKAFNITLGI